MDTSKRILIMVMVGGVLLFGFIGVMRMSSTPEQPAETVAQPQSRVLVAKRDMAHGSVISVVQDVEWLAVDTTSVAPDQFREGMVRIEDFEGAIARRQLRAGDRLTVTMLTKAGEGGFMSAVLEPGMRAISIAVNPTSGNAGFISPGDRVDLLVTHRIHASGATSNLEGAVVSETFVRDVRVIAVDQMLDNPENKAILAKTITVELTPKQAEQVAVANDLGKVSLALRSLAKSSSPTQEEILTGTIVGEVSSEVPAKDAPNTSSGFTRDKDVSRALDSDTMSSTIRVIRGDQVENVSLR